MSKFRVLGTACTLLLVSVNVRAAVVFYVEPNVGGTVDSTRDLGFQAAVGNSFVELDLDGLSNGAPVDTLPAGGVTIDVGLANPAASTVEAFAGSYSSGGGSYGTVSGSALLNRSTGVTSAGDMVFDFSSAIGGFGAWIFDDTGPTSPETGYTMTVTETNGAMNTSGLLSAGNAGSFFVEGFLAATSDVGIQSVTISTNNSGDFFEVDHLQVATSIVPVPAAVWLFGSALAGLGWMRRKQAF